MPMVPMAGGWGERLGLRAADVLCSSARRVAPYAMVRAMSSLWRKCRAVTAYVVSPAIRATESTRRETIGHLLNFAEDAQHGVRSYLRLVKMHIVAGI